VAATTFEQSLRTFTVQIRHVWSRAIKGTGILVTPSQIVTCEHVLRDAGINPKSGAALTWKLWLLGLLSLHRRRDAPAELEVHLQGTDGTGWTGRARLSARFTDSKDDVVMLDVVGDLPPVEADRVAVLGRAKLGENHKFDSWGYPERGKHVGLPLKGNISRTVPIEGITTHAEHLFLTSNQRIEPGMSGAAVLDRRLSLVVGIIAETWVRGRDSPGENEAWAVDAQVLAIDPFRLPVWDKAPKRPHRQRRADATVARSVVVIDPGIYSYDDPAVPEVWVGRDREIALLNSDLETRKRRMVGLVGFAGEGKRTLVRRWLHETGSSEYFWWTFKPEQGVDLFFERAFTYMTQGKVELREPNSNSRRVVISSLLPVRRYLFVLDGLENVQRQDPDGRGVIRNRDLRAFIHSFAADSHRSFCVVTSSLPLTDLIGVPSENYVERSIGPLETGEGVALLRAYGVKGGDRELEQLVERWGGHALTLSLIGGLARQPKDDRGEAARPPTPPSAPIAGPDTDRLLKFYDGQLNEGERAIVEVASAFRRSIDQAWLEELTRELTNHAAPAAGDIGRAFDQALNRLIAMRIVSPVADGKVSVHPLIAAHYRHRLSKDRVRLHASIANLYQSIAPQPSRSLTLSQLSPLVEAVHHLCEAGRYERALELYREILEQGDDFRLMSWKLGAYDTVSSLMDDFFPNGDTEQQPLLRDSRARRFVQNRKGVALMNIGHLEHARTLFERAISTSHRGSLRREEIQSCQNMAEVCFYLGALTDSARYARRALELARRLADRQEVSWSLAYLGWALSVTDLETARSAFDEAERLQAELTPMTPYITDSSLAVSFAYLLRRMGDVTRARQLTQANLELATQTGGLDEISICHRMLGELESNVDSNSRAAARRFFDTAVKTAEATSSQIVLSLALVARGRWAARWGNTTTAKLDLAEAAEYTDASQYRLLHVDRQVSLAWLHARIGEETVARSVIDYASRVSRQIGYAWGEEDAAAVAQHLDADTTQSRPH
jgi:pentatricopeptide repeat protein